MSVIFLDRQAWGADAIPYRLGGRDDPRPGKRDIALSERLGSVNHHTVSVDPDTSPNVWENVAEVKANARRIQQARPDLGGGFLDVPYNFLGYLMTDASVTICEGRGWVRSGAHTAGKGRDGQYLNITQLATSWGGNFEDNRLDISPWLPAINEWHHRQKQMAPKLQTITGHQDWAFASDLNRTACPGHSIYTRLREFSFEPPEEDDMDEVARKAIEELKVADNGLRTLLAAVGQHTRDNRALLKAAYDDHLALKQRVAEHIARQGEEPNLPDDQANAQLWREVQERIAEHEAKFAKIAEAVGGGA